MRRRTGFLLFVASLLVYNANLREISQTDTIPTRLLPLAILHEHRLNLNTFFRDHLPGTPLPFWVQRVDDQYLSSYPVLPALLATPVYLVPVLLFERPSWSLVNLLSKLSASLMAAHAHTPSQSLGLGTDRTPPPHRKTPGGHKEYPTAGADRATRFGRGVRPDEERARRRGAAVQAFRGERGVVSAEPGDLRRAPAPASP